MKRSTALMLLFLMLGVLVPGTGGLLAIESAKPDWQDPRQEALYDRLVHEVRCLVCQNQTIADSNAALAADLRREIRAMVLAGKNETEIEDFLLERYGDFVLYRPRFKPDTAVLWLAPGVLILIGGIALWRTVRRRATLPIGSDDDESADEES